MTCCQIGSSVFPSWIKKNTHKKKKHEPFRRQRRERKNSSLSGLDVIPDGGEEYSSVKEEHAKSNPSFIFFFPQPLSQDCSTHSHYIHHPELSADPISQDYGNSPAQALFVLSSDCAMPGPMTQWLLIPQFLQLLVSGFRSKWLWVICEFVYKTSRTQHLDVSTANKSSPSWYQFVHKKHLDIFTFTFIQMRKRRQKHEGCFKQERNYRRNTNSHIWPCGDLDPFGIGSKM